MLSSVDAMAIYLRGTRLSHLGCCHGYSGNSPDTRITELAEAAARRVNLEQDGLESCSQHIGHILRGIEGLLMHIMREQQKPIETRKVFTNDGWHDFRLRLEMELIDVNKRSDLCA